MQSKDKFLNLCNIKAVLAGEIILDGFNLDISHRQFVTLLGPSGCGKTTTLRIIGGFFKPESGEIFFEGKRISDLPPNKRELNTVFQKYALFSHLNVYENVAFGLRVKKLSESEIKSRVGEVLEMVSMENYAHRSVDSLSGGQQQRVAVARALANRPKLLLLDEPFAALDLRLRKDMQRELMKIREQTGITFVFVTHDQEEALSMSDVVVVLNNGKIQQIGTPMDVYNEPKNAFVADFIGESNIISGVVTGDFHVNFAGHNFNCVDFGFPVGEQVDVVVRPEDVKITKPDKGLTSGKVVSVIFKGIHNEIIADIKGFKWLIQTTEWHNKGEYIGINLCPNDIHIMRKSEYSEEIGDYSSFSDEFYDEEVI
jgi:spermidine/putrescine transport system ATP-binding protein